MKIFNWIHGKIHGKQSINKPNSNTSANTSCVREKEEFSDWPNGLLAIGTFGNNNLQKDSQNSSNNNNLQEDPPSCEDHHHNQDDDEDQEFRVEEEVGELRKELKLLVHKHSVNGSSAKENVALEKLFECLENEMMICDNENCVGKKKVCGKDVQMENTSNPNVIGKRSLSFLLKKAILCRGGFSLPPSPRPPLPLRERLPVEAKFQKSRMEKILRAILHKKIYPQASNPRASSKKFLDKNIYLCDSEDEAVEKAIEGSKWVKTDSDFIVLEI